MAIRVRAHYCLENGCPSALGTFTSEAPAIPPHHEKVVL